MHKIAFCQYGTSFQFLEVQGLNARAIPNEDIAEPRSLEKNPWNKPIRTNPTYRYLENGVII